MIDEELRILERAARDERTPDAIRAWRAACAERGVPELAGFAKGDVVLVTCEAPRYFYLVKRLVSGEDRRLVEDTTEPGRIEVRDRPLDADPSDPFPWVRRELCFVLKPGESFRAWVTTMGSPLPGMPTRPTIGRLIVDEGKPDLIGAERVAIRPDDELTLIHPGHGSPFPEQGVERLRDVR